MSSYVCLCLPTVWWVSLSVYVYQLYNETPSIFQLSDDQYPQVKIYICIINITHHNNTIWYKKCSTIFSVQ